MTARRYCTVSEFWEGRCEIGVTGDYSFGKVNGAEWSASDIEAYKAEGCFFERCIFETETGDAVFCWVSHYDPQNGNWEFVDASDAASKLLS